MYQRKRKLGRGVAVVGAGMSRFAPAAEGTRTQDLFAEAFNDMRSSLDKDIGTEDIEALYLGNCSSDIFERQLHIAPVVGDWVDLVPKPVLKLEDACASGGVAFRQGVLAIASGLYDIVLTGGIEKMTNLPTEGVTETLAFGLDGQTEYPTGLTFPGIYACIATAHMEKYGTTVEDFMRVAIKNHHNGSLNPKAHFNLSIKDIMKRRAEAALKKGLPEPKWVDEMDFLHDPIQNPVIAWPMMLFDCSTVCDGAACALLVAEDIARDITDKPLYLIGTGQASDYPLHRRDEMTSLDAAKIAASEAYTMAGVTPKDIKVAQVHDCFTIAEIVAMEDLGFFKPGEAVEALRGHMTDLDGILPVNSDGGLKAKGHPIGASGMGMVVELWKQMRGEAGPRQITGRNLDIGLMHNVGAHGATVVVNIFAMR